MPSFSGLTYLFGFFVTAFLSYRFFQYWQREKTYTAKNFFYFIVIFASFCLITALGAILFPQNLIFLKGVVISATFLQGLAYAFLGALTVYLKFPRFSPKYGFGLVFLLGIIGTILIAALPFNPHLMENNWIDWDIQFWPGVFRLTVHLLAFLPLGVIMIQQGLSSLESEAKEREAGLGLIFLLFSLSTPLIFIVKGSLPERIGEDFIALVILSLVLIIVVLTQKPSKPKWVKKIE